MLVVLTVSTTMLGYIFSNCRLEIVLVILVPHCRLREKFRYACYYETFLLLLLSL
jgi:hypothetical protein